ncbi:hypothetical protein LguiA_030224 [Lonicera macranthoides]
MVTFNTVKRHVIHRHSNMVRNFIDSLSQVDTEHAGLPENKEYVDLKFLAVYEAKTNGSVTTRISKVFDPHKNSGNYFLVQLENEIVGGEKIEVCFEIAPSACIVVKMCQVQLFHITHEGGFSIDKIHGHQIGFDLVETSSGLADKDYDSKGSSIIWEDEDPMINNKRDTEYIHMFHDNINGKFIIGKHNTVSRLY